MPGRLERDADPEAGTPMSDDKPYRVFISYTGEDLSDHADVARDVVRKLEWVAVDHRDWGARETRSCDACRETVQRCDVLVVLVAHRYGWVPPVEQGGDGKTSITWWEVRWAREHGLPVLAYLVKDDFPWPPDKIESLTNPEAGQRLAELKAELRESVVGFFTTPDSSLDVDLAINLQRAARRIEHDRAAPAAEAPAVAAAPAGPAVQGARIEPPATPSYTYRTLQLRFGEGAEGRYPVELAELPSGHPTAGQCRLDPVELKRLLWSTAGVMEGRVRRTSAGADSLLPRTADVKRVGGMIYESLFASDFREHLESSLRSIDPQHGSGIRFLIDTTRSRELAELPWEFAYDEAHDNFLFTDEMTPMVRWLEDDQLEPTLAVRPPLRLLVAVAGPADRPELRVGEELAHLDDELRDLVGEGLIETFRLDHASANSLDAALLRHEPHVLHFVGHGDFADGEGVVVLESEDPPGGSHAIPGPRLANYLRNHRAYLRLVFLNSCLGAAASAGDPFGGVAHSLIRRGMPAVIAMQFPISDRAAVTLARQFYRYLAKGRPVDAALTSARSYLALSYDVEWGSPALHMRARDGRLFDLAAAGQPAPVSYGVPAPASGTREVPADSDDVEEEAAPPPERQEPAPPSERREPRRSAGAAAPRRKRLALGGLAAVVAAVLTVLLMRGWNAGGPEAAAPYDDDRLVEGYLEASEAFGSADSRELRETLRGLELTMADDPGGETLGRFPELRDQLSERMMIAAKETRSAGDLEQALRILESSLAIAPDQHEALQALEEIRAELGPPMETDAGDLREREVRAGDTLWAVAGEAYGDPARWLAIYDANRGRLRDPDVILPGQVLVIPQPVDPGSPAEAVRYEIADGDHLWKIAGIVYGDPRLWPRIYEANRDRIADPDLIYPSQQLVIPRDGP